MQKDNEIANYFNQYFTDIGPNLAAEVYSWSFPVTVGFTILAIRTVLLSAIVLFIQVISCDIVYI